MGSFLVPRVGIAMVLALAAVLIGVVLRGPDSHSNLWNALRQGYSRTPVDVVAADGKTAEYSAGAGSVAVYLQVPAGQALAETKAVDVPSAGQRLYIVSGCAKCHGIQAQGGVVGPPLAGKPPQLVSAFVRLGPGGMPAFTEDILSDEELSQIAEYLASLEPIASR